EHRAVMLFQVMAVAASHGEAPVAERLLRIAVACRAEQDRRRAAARLALSVGERLERLADERVELLRVALHGAIDGAAYGRRQHVVADGAGGAAVDQFAAVGVADVEALAGLAAEVILGELHKHGDGTRWGQED